ncbi:integrase catalytic domain-containing protein [Trichonephila clavipes]|nr:integrase catalytic domain-containing protein [Trichonephila clavipes]
MVVGGRECGSQYQTDSTKVSWKSLRKEAHTVIRRRGESVTNERPLTYVSDDPNEMTVIIPAHFIQDIRGAKEHGLDIMDSKYLSKRMRYLQNVRGNLRKYFQTECLGELVRIPKSTSKRKEITVGEIFVIGSDNSKRLKACGSPVVKVSDHGRHVMSLSPVTLKTRRLGQRCTLNLSRAETSSRWCGVVTRRGGASSGVIHVT